METKQKPDQKVSLHDSNAQQLTKSKRTIIEQATASLLGNESIGFEAEAHVQGKFNRTRGEIEAEIKAKANLPMSILRNVILFLPNLLKKKQGGE